MLLFEIQMIVLMTVVVAIVEGVASSAGSVAYGDGAALPAGTPLAGAGVAVLAQVGADCACVVAVFRWLIRREVSGIAAVCGIAAVSAAILWV